MGLGNTIVGKRYGVIAQEIQNAFPEIVHELTDHPGYLAVDYSEIPPVLIQAIKELDQKITDIETQLGN